MITEDTLKKMINVFNFYRVATAMKALGWFYAGSGRIPTILELKQTVWSLYQAVDDWNVEERIYISSGGFALYKDKDSDYLTLGFIVEEAESRY